MKTGVLVHGCNLFVENWRYVAWGDPPHQLGRIPHGILTALEWGAEVIVFGTGASRKPFPFEGSPKYKQELAEAEYSLEYLKLQFGNLQSFQPLVDRLGNLNERELEQVSSRVFDRLVLDLESTNTVEEIVQAGLVFRERGIEQVILVSSPTHIVRCLRDATAIYLGDDRFQAFRHNLYASPSITSYEGASGSDVVVVEPPHRPGRHVVPTHRRIQRMMALQNLPFNDLVELIDEFDDMLQKYENRFFTEGRREKK